MKYFPHVLAICVAISCVRGQYVLSGQKKFLRDRGSSEERLPRPPSPGQAASEPLPGESHVPPRIPESPPPHSPIPVAVSESTPAQGQAGPTGSDSSQMPGQVQPTVATPPQPPGDPGTAPNPQSAGSQVPSATLNPQPVPGENAGAATNLQPVPGEVAGAVSNPQSAPEAVSNSQSAPGAVTNPSPAPGAAPNSQPAPGEVPGTAPYAQPVPDHILGTLPNSPTSLDHGSQQTVLTLPPLPGVSMSNLPPTQGHAPAAMSNSPLVPGQASMAAPNFPQALGHPPRGISNTRLAPGQASVPSSCAQLNGRCWNSEDCCLGLGCISGICREGMQRNSKGEPVDHVEVIETEMSTGHNVDVSGHHNIHMLASLEECGQFNLHKTPHNHRHKRIVGGTTFEVGKYPWLVSLNLQYSNNDKTLDSPHCGASVIGRRHILTVAHCITRVPTGFMLKYATLGLVDRRIKLNCEEDPSLPNCNENSFIDVEIEDIHVHERYSDAHVRNDIALIILKHELNYTDYIQPICLARNEKIFKKWRDGKMTVVGWGSQNIPTDTGSPVYARTAKELDMILVHRNSCDRFFTRMIGKLRRSQICVVGPPGTADCAGDSGSPLFKKLESESDGNPDTKEERYFLFGLVSSGADLICGRQGKPSVFTSVMDYMPWILDHMLPKNEIVGEPVSREPVNIIEEFATGFNMDVSTHKNVGILPQFPNCGIIEGQMDHKWPAAGSTTGNKTQVKNRVKRIVGGIIQSVGAFPWLGQIILRNVDTTEPLMQCGGALISSRHVLTAAHCIDSLRGPYALDGVMLGNFNRMERRECIGNECIEPQVLPIEEVFVHDGFTKYAREHDVAIIKLAHEVKFNRFIQPICLPLSEQLVPFAWPEPENDRRYVAAGWGRVTSDDDPSEAVYSNLLIGANFTLESKKFCDSTLVRRSGNVENARICGGGTMPGRGECIGDTGGPMMRWVTLQDIHGQWYTRMFTFGVLSVVECAHQGIPSLYQNLLYHMPWIMDHLDA